MGDSRVQVDGKSSSTLTPGFKPEGSSFLEQRYQDQVEVEPTSPNAEKQLSTFGQTPPTPPPSDPTPLSHSFGRMTVLPIQAKLTIGQPNDKYEQEADRVAEQVMRMPEPGSPAAAIITRPIREHVVQRMCSDCEEEVQRQPLEEAEEDEEIFQAKPITGFVMPLIQRQQAPPEEEEEDKLQMKPLGSQITRLIQRQAESSEEEDEETIQTKLAGYLVSPLVQRQAEEGEEEEEEEGMLQAKEQDALSFQPLNTLPGETVQRQPMEAEEEAEEEEEEGDTIQAKLNSPVQEPLTDISIIVKNPGLATPLPSQVRARIEPVVGADLRHVRLHRDAKAQEATRALHAKAFTHRNHIWLGQNQSPNDLKLIAHEVTHVIQQNDAGSPKIIEHQLSNSKSGLQAYANARFLQPPDRLIQRAEYTTIDSVSHLFLEVPFGEEIAVYDLILNSDLASYFESDDGLAQEIENELERIFNPEDITLHETVDYLEGPGITQLVIRGLRRLVNTGAYNFSELNDLLQRRTALFNSQDLLPDATDWLAEQLGVEPAEIDWSSLLPQLKTRANEFEPVTMVGASLRDRYIFFLDILELEVEATELEPVLGAVSISAEDADSYLMSYVSSYGSDLFTEDVFAYHSEKFLEEYIPLLESIQYVPQDFDLESFRPITDTSEVDARREEIITEFIENEAHGRVVMYVLDRWTESRLSPENFLGNLNLEDFREELTAHLASELVSRARQDPDIMAALRSRAVDEARFTQVAWLYHYGQSLEERNRTLGDTFTTVPILELSDEDWAIASDPYAYRELSSHIANTLHGLLSSLSPNSPIEMDVFRAAIEILEAQDIPPQFAGLFLLPELFGYLRALENALEEQERETQRTLQARLDLDFEDIADVVRNYIEHAERFIREEWIPMLKEVALERANENLAELRYLDEHWEDVRRYRIVQFAQGAAELEYLANGLESGRYEQVEFDRRVIRRDGIEHLRNAAKVMRAAGLQQLDREEQDEQREKVQGVIEDYGKIVEGIQDGDYDPLDYSSAVYSEARERLNIGSIRPATVGMVLSREVTAAENPFLYYAIVRWKFKEGLERSFERALTLVALGILTLAAALVPGALGVVLAAIDIGLGIYSGIQQVIDAKAMLRMARLDIHGDIVGVSETQAEEALKHAWIGLAVSVAITAGVGALRARTMLHRYGGARVPRSRSASGPSRRVTGTQRRLLDRTRGVHGSQLSPDDLAGEAQVAARGRSQPSTMGGFDEQIRLPNDHVWRRRGRTWCRFSIRPFCMPSSSLPRSLRRRAYRDVARTLDEGVDASGNIVRNRGHSHSDHGAQTNPVQHERRLRTGISPGGRNTRRATGELPEASSKFSSHRAHLDAYQRALDDLAENYLRTSGTPKAEYSHRLSLRGAGKRYTIEGGTLDSSGNLVGGTLQETTVHNFFFAFRRNSQGWYDLITMYPVP